MTTSTAATTGSHKMPSDTRAWAATEDPKEPKITPFVQAVPIGSYGDHVVLKHKHHDCNNHHHHRQQQQQQHNHQPLHTTQSEDDDEHERGHHRHHVNAIILEPAPESDSFDEEADVEEGGGIRPTFDSSYSSFASSVASSRATVDNVHDMEDLTQARPIDHLQTRRQEQNEATIYAQLYRTCIFESESSTCSVSSDTPSSSSSSIPYDDSSLNVPTDLDFTTAVQPFDHALEEGRLPSATPHLVPSHLPSPPSSSQCEHTVSMTTVLQTASATALPTPVETPPVPKFTSVTFWPWPAPHKSLGLSLIPRDALAADARDSNNDHNDYQEADVERPSSNIDGCQSPVASSESVREDSNNTSPNENEDISARFKGTVLDGDGYNIIVDEVFRDDFLYNATLSSGDMLVSINHENCKGWSFKKFWKKIMKSKSLKGSGSNRRDNNSNAASLDAIQEDVLTLVFHNPRGDPHLVGSVIRRLYPSRMLRLTLKRRSNRSRTRHNGLLITEIRHDNLLAHSLLNEKDELIFVNQTPITVDITTTDVGQLIGVDRQTCLLVARTSPHTGVVVVSNPPSSAKRCYMCISKFFNSIAPSYYLTLFIGILVMLMIFVIMMNSQPNNVGGGETDSCDPHKAYSDCH